MKKLRWLLWLLLPLVASAQTSFNAQTGLAQTWTAAQTFTVAAPFPATSLTSQPAAVATPDAGNVPYVLSQTGLPIVLPGSGYMDATGNLVLGQSPGNSATVTFSGTLTPGSTGITATCSAICFTGTSAGDVGRVITVYSGSAYLICTVTAFSSTTVATCTAASTNSASLSASAYTNATSWISGTNTTTNTAYSGGSVLSVPLARTYASAYLYFPASSPIGTAGWYYTTCTTATTCLVKNNTIAATGTPSIPGSPTAFSGLTPGTYTQTTGSYLTAATIHIPANAMGLNGEVTISWSTLENNSGNNKTVNAQWAGTTIFYNQGTTSLNYIDTATVRNSGVANVQSYTNWVSQNGVAPSVNNSVAAINTAAQVSIAMSMNLATATDEFSIDSYSVKVSPN